MRIDVALAKRVLAESRNLILEKLTGVIKDNDFSYRTFGSHIEDYLSDILIKIFRDAKIILSDEDFKVAKDKNEFPDFQLLSTDMPLAIEYKSGNVRKLLDGAWKDAKNSNNDLGTFNSWPDKLTKFWGENIFFIFVIYKIDDTTKKMVDVQIAPFYRFLGLNSKHGLKYREKDGNLRPRDFFEEPPLKTFESFSDLFLETQRVRSESLVRKHKAIIKKSKSGRLPWVNN